MEIVAVQCLFVYNIFGRLSASPCVFRHLYRERNVAYKMARIFGIAMPGNFIFIGIFDSETGFQTVFGIVVVV